MPQNITLIQQGNDWKFSSFMQHVKRVTPRMVGILDHNTNDLVWMRSEDFNKVVNQYSGDDHLTFRILEKQTNKGQVRCIEVMHF